MISSFPIDDSFIVCMHHFLFPVTFYITIEFPDSVVFAKHEKFTSFPSFQKKAQGPKKDHNVFNNLTHKHMIMSSNSHDLYAQKSTLGISAI